MRVLSVGAASFTSHTGYMATETRATTFVTGASRWRWQIAFLVIGSNPRRFRALMIPAITEKFGWQRWLCCTDRNASHRSKQWLPFPTACLVFFSLWRS